MNPSGETKTGFGNFPFARDEFTADNITLYVNLDLGQIRGYGLGADAERLLILLALYKLRSLLDGSLRLRTACDLRAKTDSVEAVSPNGFALPAVADMLPDLKAAIVACQGLMTISEAAFNDELKKAKDDEPDNEGAPDPEASGD